MISLNTLIKSAAVLVLIGGTVGVIAEDSVNTRPGSFNQRIYAGIGLGASRLEPRSRVPGVSIGDKNDSGMHLNLGIDLKRWLSAEVLYADLGAAGVDQLGRQIDEIDYQVFDISAIFYLLNSQSNKNSDRQSDGLFRREGASLYARAGIGAMRNSSSFVDHGKNFHAHLGVGLGLEYGFQSGIALRGEYIAFDSDAHYATIGAIKRFGKTKQKEPPVVPPVDEPPEENPPAEPPITVIPPVFPAGTLFETDSNILSAEAKRKFGIFAQRVIQAGVALKIEGHTDSVGRPEYNLALGQRRADAVRDFLVGEGIAESDIRTVSFGEERPVSTNETAEGRAENRRVVVLLD